ncbi:MAG: type II secretion system protein N [Desulfobacteria bacterium]
MRKPVCLAVVGISIVVAAGSLGVALTRYLGLLAYSPKGTAQATAAPAGNGIPATPPEQWNNLFAPGDGMKTASRLPAASGKSASQAPRTSFVLVGTISSSSPTARRAVLWSNGMKEPKTFREMEEVEPGAFLASVERDKVWIERGKEREKLEILPVGRRAGAAATESPAVAPAGASAVPPPASSPGTPSLPGMAVPPPGPAPARTQAVTAPHAAPGAAEDMGSNLRERRGRLRGLRR